MGSLYGAGGAADARRPQARGQPGSTRAHAPQLHPSGLHRFSTKPRLPRNTHKTPRPDHERPPCSSVPPRAPPETASARLAAAAALALTLLAAPAAAAPETAPARTPGTTHTVPLQGIARDAPAGEGRTIAAIPRAPPPAPSPSRASPGTTRPRTPASSSPSARESQGKWSSWRTIRTTGDRPADTARRGASEPLWMGRSDAVQARVGLLSGDVPRGLRLELVDPGVASVDGKVRPRGAGGRPAIVSRAAWGADESLREADFKYTDTVKVVFVHHTADSNTYSCADSPAVLRSIYRYHVKTNGWSDIGYNFLVDRCGTIFEGRAGGVDKAVRGAHTLGFNTDSMGVAAIGTYTDTAPPAALLEGLTRVIAWKLGMYGRNPLGQDQLTSGDSASRFAAGTNVRFNVVSGHRDAFVTECPGQALYDNLPRLRRGAAKALGT
ncbi:peptidoglycan recognition protein family protein [Yinghuangia aomiensis]